MRGEHYAPRVPSPGFKVHSRVVFPQERIARVAENALDEIEIAYERPRGEKAYLHSFFSLAVRNRRAHSRAQVEGNPRPALALLGGRERKLEQLVGRVKRARPQIFENRLGHGLLVGGNRKAALGDVEYARRRAPVAARVVQNALPYAVGGHERAFVPVAVRREGKHARGPEPIEDESLVRNRRERLARVAHVGEVFPHEVHYAPVGGTIVFGRAHRKLAVVFEQRPGELHNRIVALVAEHRQPRRGEPHVHIFEERLAPDFVVPRAGIDSKR